MKGLTLNTREQNRLQTLNGVLERHWPMREAAKVMGVSERQGWRILAAYRKEGAAALAHGNRGCTPANATPLVIRQQVVAMAKGRYSGVNHTHLAELLAEREGIMLSRSTLRRLLAGAGLSSPRRGRSPRHRYRRQRMPQEGMLLQLDGSRHRWLENRGPWLTLLLAVDDATGTVPYALFREQEDTLGYFELLKVIINRCGIPLGVYTDRDSIFHVARGPSNGAGSLTQFGRALRELGVTHVLAHSPEAKGRVERANGTFQDRLVSELRLTGASTALEANLILWDFLPRFNERFGVPAAQPGQAYRPISLGLDPEGILCVKERRRVARDNTVQYRQRTLQLFPDADRPSYAGAHVEIQERLDGQILACYQGKILTPQDAPPLAAKLRAQAKDIPDYPVMWEEPPPRKVRERRKRTRVWLGPLAGDTIWYEDPVRKNKHRELTRAGMERARQAGKRIGGLTVEEREGFAEKFAPVLAQLGQKTITRRQAAEELGISCPTLKRLLDEHLAATRRAPVRGEERTASVV
ncbi:MAG: ISNCY family transposase [Chloroflexi bacterium]|nr:ISNCY family transposase [Chloroflexota bacterium]